MDQHRKIKLLNKNKKSPLIYSLIRIPTIQKYIWSIVWHNIFKVLKYNIPIILYYLISNYKVV